MNSGGMGRGLVQTLFVVGVVIVGCLFWVPPYRPIRNTSA